MGKLDNIGVAYLWKKITNAFEAKPVCLEAFVLRPSDFTDFTAEIVDSRIKADSRIWISYSVTSIPVVNKAGILAASESGKIVFTAKKVPLADINIDLIEIRQKG